MGSTLNNIQKVRNAEERKKSPPLAQNVRSLYAH